jgi:hypothetical protein
MKNMQRFICAITLGLLMQAPGEVVFLDTFDRTAELYTDINANLVARQAGGTTGSSYTGTINGGGGGLTLGSNGNLGSDTLLLRTDGPATSAEYTSVDLDTDFGSSLVDQQWTFSYRTRLQRAIGYSGYTGFAVGNPADTTSGAGNGVSFQIAPTGGWTLYSAGSLVGSGNLGEVTYYNNYTVTGTFDEALGTAAFSVYFETSMNTVDTGSFAVSFADDGRFFELRNHLNTTTADGVVDAVFDNLKIETIPEPATLGMMGIAAFGILMVRRLRM